MNLENIKNGMMVKNYKVMCSLLGEEVGAGNSKKYQIKEWERHFKFHKKGNKFIIDEIYKEPKIKYVNQSGKNNNNWKEYENLNIKYEERNNIGIYKIVKDNQIYVGSTVVGFRERFKQHKYGSEKMEHTKELLENGGIFSILVNMTGIQDVDLVRMVEDYFIRYYENDYDWISLNSRKGSWSEKKPKFKNIKVDEKYFLKAMNLLISNGLINVEEGRSC